MDRDEARQYWDKYLRGQDDESDPEACRLLADLGGFPPVMWVVPELDLVAEDSLRMYARLQEAGVDATCKTYPGAVHSFLDAMSISNFAWEGIADGVDFISRHICSHK